MTFLKRNNKNILIGVLFILLISACALIIYLLNTKALETPKEIIGNVIISDKEYLMLESENENYLITGIKGNYDIGDKIKLIYLESKMNKEASPKQINISDEELIEKSSIWDSNENTNKVDFDEENNNNNNKENQNNTNKPNNKNENTEIKESADTAVMNYVNSVQTEMDKPNLGESAKKGFITVIDFLFYNGTIKDYTYNDLSNSVKLKVLSSALYFDSKIDKYFPGYKESISNTTKKIYTNLKAGIITTYLNITATICSNNNELCTSAKEDFQILKKNFGLTFDLIKDIAGDGLNNLKNWYEIWSGK